MARALAVGPDLDRVHARPCDGRAYAAEVKVGGNLLGGLIDRIINFLVIDLRDKIELGAQLA